MTVRLLYLVSHPIQYQAPMLRQLAQQPDIRLRVLFENVTSDGQHFDPGFGRDIRWDVPLRDGYDNAPISDVKIADEIAGCDLLWVHGWQTATLRSAVRQAGQQGKPVLMRGENWSGSPGMAETSLSVLNFQELQRFSLYRENEQGVLS